MESYAKMELTVSLKDFVDMLKSSRFGAKLGKKNIAREDVELFFSDGSLEVISIGVRHLIPANGVWQGRVTFPLSILGGLRKVPPVQDPLLIRYAGGKLKIGTSSFSATWAER